MHGPLESAEDVYDRWYDAWSVDWLDILNGLTSEEEEEEEEEEDEEEEEEEEESTKRGKRKAPAAAAATEGDTSGDVGTEETLSQYERERLAICWQRQSS